MRRRFLILVALVATAGGLCAERIDVVLAAATDAELLPLATRLKDAKFETRAAWTFQLGRLGNKNVVLVRTEGDPLNAVAATTLAIRRYQPRLVFTFGAARAHDPALRTGDVVVSEKFAAFDGIFSPRKKLGEGSDATQWDPLPHPIMTRGEKETDMTTFPADAGSVAIIEKLLAGRVTVGVLGSAHQVNREADRIEWIRQHWGTSCEDGESAHIAGCALLLGVPVVGLRVIDGKDGEAAVVVQRFLEVWK